MRPRCVELRRVLKKTGSFYYHCDWHACHYVKVMLDQIFGENNFQNEIIWKRTIAQRTRVSQHIRTITTRSSSTPEGEKYKLNRQYVRIRRRIRRGILQNVKETGKRWSSLPTDSLTNPSEDVRI